MACAVRILHRFASSSFVHTEELPSVDVQKRLKKLVSSIFDLECFLSSQECRTIVSYQRESDITETSLKIIIESVLEAHKNEASFIPIIKDAQLLYSELQRKKEPLASPPSPSHSNDCKESAQCGDSTAVLSEPQASEPELVTCASTPPDTDVTKATPGYTAIEEFGALVQRVSVDFTEEQRSYLSEAQGSESELVTCASTPPDTDVTEATPDYAAIEEEFGALIQRVSVDLTEEQRSCFETYTIQSSENLLFSVADFASNFIIPSLSKTSGSFQGHFRSVKKLLARLLPEEIRPTQFLIEYEKTKGEHETQSAVKKLFIIRLEQERSRLNAWFEKIRVMLKEYNTEKTVQNDLYLERIEALTDEVRSQLDVCNMALSRMAFQFESLVVLEKSTKELLGKIIKTSDRCEQFIKGL